MNRMSNGRPRRARPCALCQTERVMDEKICPKCKKDYEGQMEEPWAVFALAESDATARLIRRKNAHETSLESQYIVR